MTVYGYIRVSTVDQNTDRQLEKMLAEGIALENLFVDQASGKDMDRPKWEELGSKVKRGDVIVIDALDRLGRNYYAVSDAWHTLTRDEGIDICCLEPSFMDSRKWREMGDMGVLVEDMVLGVLAWAAQHEREEILRRQKEGIQKAKQRGVYKGRSRIVVEEELGIDVARKLCTGEWNQWDAAKELNCSYQTILNMCNDGRIPYERYLAGEFGR